MITGSGVSSYTVDHLGCEEPIIPRPRCTLQQIWREAVRRGAPRGNYIGNISYFSAFGSPARWYVTIGDFSSFVADTC